MIIDKKYKVSWKHHNKNSESNLTIEGIEHQLVDIIKIADNRTDLLCKMHEYLHKPSFDRSYSECIIEIQLENIDDIRSTAWELYSHGIGLVHPNDTFNRKKGVLVSFEDAVSNISDRATRTVLWDAFWKVREPKVTKLRFVTDRDRNLRVFLDEVATKKIQGQHIKYILPEATEIWFPRND